MMATRPATTARPVTRATAAAGRSRRRRRTRLATGVRAGAIVSAIIAGSTITRKYQSIASTAIAAAATASRRHAQPAARSSPLGTGGTFIATASHAAPRAGDSFANRDSTCRVISFVRRALLVAALLPAVALFGAADSASARGSPEKRSQVVNFLAYCGVSRIAPDDRIVYPGQPGRSHHHTFFGSRAISAHATLPSLRAAETTCGRKSETAAYWVPTLFRDGRRVTPLKATAYYTLRQFSGVRPYPPGLKIIAGDADARRPQALGVVWWNCGDSGVRRSSVRPRCPQEASCWPLSRSPLPRAQDAGRRRDSRLRRQEWAPERSGRPRSRCSSTGAIRYPTPVTPRPRSRSSMRTRARERRSRRSRRMRAQGATRRRSSSRLRVLGATRSLTGSRAGTAGPLPVQGRTRSPRSRSAAPAASGSGPGSGSSPVWPVVGGFGALLVAAIVLVGLVRRHGSRAPAPA